MASVGCFLPCEELTPDQLVEQAVLAQDAGFSALGISDHYHPWRDEQGNAPFVWSVIGALSQVTDLPVTTLVTCPTVRIHPAVVAQAAATSDVMTHGRFRLGVGTGEALNEHILGTDWPAFDIRAERLEEAVEIMRELFSGKEVTHRGRYYTVEDARLYTEPSGPLPIHVSGMGPNAAELAGRIGDGLVAVKPDHDLVEAFRKAGGEGKPALGSTKVCWDTDRARAVETAHRLWASELLPGEQSQILPTPSHFEQATSLVTAERAAEEFVCGDDPEEHLKMLGGFAEAGFDEIYVAQMGPRYPGFFDFYKKSVLPRFAREYGDGDM
jgi:G6PDH family F420-dependent oxidoreductase